MQSLTDFVEDVNLSVELAGLLARQSDHILMFISDQLNRFGVRGEPYIIGSTSGRHLTAFVDPRASKDRWTVDHDIAIVVHEELSKKQKRALLKRLFVGSKLYQTPGEDETRFYMSGPLPFYLVEASVVIVSDKNNYQPILLRQSRDMSKEQLWHATALKLFASRNGLYGGYTGGYKGIALEQLIVEHGDLIGVFDFLEEEEHLVISSPVDNSNLVAGIDADVARRMHCALSKFRKTSLVKAGPYEFCDWNLDHQLGENYRLLWNGMYPYRAREHTRKAIQNICKEPNSIFVVRQNPWPLINDDTGLVGVKFASQIFVSIDYYVENPSSFYSALSDKRLTKADDTFYKGLEILVDE